MPDRTFEIDVAGLVVALVWLFLFYSELSNSSKIIL